MSNTRLPMREIRKALQLFKELSLSRRAISKACHISRKTVSDYLLRFKISNLSWPLPPELSDDALELKLFPPTVETVSIPTPLPDFAYIRKERIDYKKINLTLAQLWCEYKDANPNGYNYSYFCDLYRGWLGKQDYCMRQEHKAGEKLFVDYGDGLDVWDIKTGEATPTQLFVGVWGASNFTYAEASFSQNLPSWCGSHKRAFEYFRCVPRIIVPDNLKSGVTKPCYYDPEINATYAELAGHYGSVVIPARPQHPKDKAKVENGVLVAKRWILSVLRKRVFTSLAELNSAIKELVEILNDRVMRKIKQSRRELFESLDRPAALTLVDRPYEYAEWGKATVNIDYHVEVDHHYYSVPYRYIHEKVDVRLGGNTVELFIRGERVAAHVRSHAAHKPTTITEHMPPAHQKYLEWTPSRIIEWAAKTGPATAEAMKRIMESKSHPEQGYRACLGVLRLGKSCGAGRLEAACARAVKFNACGYGTIRSILSAGLDRQRSGNPPAQTVLPFHENLRGGQYYHS